MKFDIEICKGVSCPECSFNKGKDGCLLAKRLDEIEIIPEPCEDAVHAAYKHGKSKGIKKGLGMRKDAQPELIRCKDCRWWDVSPSSTSAPAFHRCRGFEKHHTKADEFCSRAERREDEE